MNGYYKEALKWIKESHGYAVQGWPKWFCHFIIQITNFLSANASKTSTKSNVIYA